MPPGEWLSGGDDGWEWVEWIVMCMGGGGAPLRGLGDRLKTYRTRAQRPL